MISGKLRGQKLVELHAIVLNFVQVRRCLYDEFKLCRLAYRDHENMVVHITKKEIDLESKTIKTLVFIYFLLYIIHMYFYSDTRKRLVFFIFNKKVI